MPGARARVAASGVVGNLVSVPCAVRLASAGSRVTPVVTMVACAGGWYCSGGRGESWRRQRRRGGTRGRGSIRGHDNTIRYRLPRCYLQLGEIWYESHVALCDLYAYHAFIPCCASTILAHLALLAPCRLSLGWVGQHTGSRAHSAAELVNWHYRYVPSAAWSTPHRTRCPCSGSRGWSTSSCY